MATMRLSAGLLGSPPPSIPEVIKCVSLSEIMAIFLLPLMLLASISKPHPFFYHFCVCLLASFVTIRNWAGLPADNVALKEHVSSFGKETVPEITIFPASCHVI